jgi:hypothetical protein
MKGKYVLSIAVGAIGSAAIAVTVAYAHGGFHHHHGSAAAKACIAVMTPDQRGNLKSIFSDAKGTIITDHQNVQSARQALSEAILSKNGNLAPLETSLSNAQMKLLQDEDAAAVKVCGLLNDKQLSAAEGLYKNMVALRQSSHQQARDYFNQARTAAGDTTSTTTTQTPAE